MGDIADKSIERRSYGVRVGFFFGALFLIMGTLVPFLPVWLYWRGLSVAEIGLVTGAPYFIRLVVTPALAIAADHRGAHRSMLIGLVYCALAAVFALAFSSGFWLIFLFAVLFSIAITSIVPLTEAIASDGVRTYALDYGRMRLWGSLTFIGAGFIGGGLVDYFGGGAGVWLLAIATAATCAAASLLPRPAGVETHHSGAAAPFDRAALAALVRSRAFLTFLLAAGMIQGAHATFYAFGTLHWQAQGISTTWAGALWSIGVIAEILVFAWSGALLRRVGAVWLLVAGAGASIVRWSLMSLDPPLAALVALQAAHGLTYGASHLGAIHYINRAVPRALAGTAQALYQTVAVGIALGGGAMLSGALDAIHSGTAYLIMALFGGIGLGASLALLRMTSEGGTTPAKAAVEPREGSLQIGPLSRSI